MGTARFGNDGYTEGRVDLPDEAISLLTGPAPVRIGLSSTTVSAQRLGKGDDARELGIAVDRIILR